MRTASDSLWPLERRVHELALNRDKVCDRLGAVAMALGKASGFARACEGEAARGKQVRQAGLRFGSLEQFSHDPFEDG